MGMWRPVYKQQKLNLRNHYLNTLRNSKTKMIKHPMQKLDNGLIEQSFMK